MQRRYYSLSGRHRPVCCVPCMRELCNANGILINAETHSYHHHISVMELGHLLTRSVLTYPEGTVILRSKFWSTSVPHNKLLTGGHIWDEHNCSRIINRVKCNPSLTLSIAYIHNCDTLWYRNTDMRRLTTAIGSGKCVVRRFRRCANVYLHKPI